MIIKSPVTKNILTYLLIVILPTLICSVLFMRYSYDQTIESEAERTEDIIHFHKNYIDSFIGETIASLETLSYVIHNKENQEEIEQILTKFQDKDDRYSGFYWANLEGDILISSNKTNKKVNIFQRDYFQQVLSTKETRVSPAHIGSITGRKIVTIATPVISNEKIEGVLLVSLRLDYLENVLKVLTPDAFVRVIDTKDQIIIRTNQDFNSITTPLISSRLDNVSWKIEARPGVNFFNKNIFTLNSIIFCILVFILTHILFLLAKYIMLKRQAKRERAENDLQKLELIGTLAASTAHEIKNPLTGIKGLIQLLSEKHKDSSDQFYFSVIQEEITRINDIVNEFLVLGKPTAEKLARYELNEIIKELEPIIQSEANLYNLGFKLELSKSPLHIMCSKDNIKQLVLNLSKNALESMHEKGGTLSITVNKEETNSLLVISDTGTGIPEHLLKKLFTPFYTSKDTGTGLGLVICKRIVDMYKGTIEVQSTAGQGTNVEVRFPICQSKVDQLSSTNSNSSSLYS
ncbi:ATP-binding protein [Fredinandcohnia humi]